LLAILGAKRNTGILPVRPADILSAALSSQRSATPLGAQTGSLCSARAWHLAKYEDQRN